MSYIDRIKVQGTEYDVLDRRVRLADGQDFDYGTLVQGGINNNNGYTTGAQLRRSETYWPVIEGSANVIMQNGLTGYIRLYDADKTMIDPGEGMPGSDTTNHVLVIAKNTTMTLTMKEYNPNTAYFRFYFSCGSEEYVSALVRENARIVPLQTVATSGDMQMLDDDVSDLKSALDLVTDFVGYDEPVDLKGTDWGVGYFNTSTGAFVDCVGSNNNNSKRIVQKAIHHTDKAIVCNIASGYRYILQFWNSDGSHKATTSWQTGEYTIPAGSYYVAGQVAQLTDSVNITDYTQNGLYDAFSMEYADGSGKGSTTTIPEQFDAIEANIDDIRDEIGAFSKTIVCFGNSLTTGATASYSNPWPTQLEALLPDYTIKNRGISGEGVQTIGARQGGIPMLTDGAFTIPADTAPVAITFTNMLGGSPTPLVQLGTSKATPGINPCSIAGVSGNLTLSNGVYYFTRTTAGSAVTVNRPTAIITDSMKNDRADILVLWTGENGQFDDSYDNLIAYEKLIVDYSKNRNYLIIGRSNASYTGAWGTAYNRGMMLAHGRKYINIVEYLSKYGLSDLNITPTANDETAISNGFIPPSLKTDSTHLTTDAYGIVARLVYERGVELGYWI